MFEIRAPLLTIAQLQEQIGGDIPPKAKAFKTWLESHVEECKAVTQLGISGNEVSSLAMLRYFPNLKKLIVFGGTGTTVKGVYLGPALKLDGIQHCTKLEELFVANGTEELDLRACALLKKVSLTTCRFFSQTLQVFLPGSVQEKELRGYFV